MLVLMLKVPLLSFALLIGFGVLGLCVLRLQGVVLLSELFVYVHAVLVWLVLSLGLLPFSCFCVGYLLGVSLSCAMCACLFVLYFLFLRGILFFLVVLSVGICLSVFVGGAQSLVVYCCFF